VVFVGVHWTNAAVLDIKRLKLDVIHLRGCRVIQILNTGGSALQISANHVFKKKIKMGCPALGVSVAFLKQPDAVPGRAPLKN
jgi:hypothetical protein